MVLGIHHVQLTVPPGSLDAVRAFYVDRLGFVAITDPFGIDGFWLAAGPQQLHIRVEPDVDRHKTRAHPAFVVDQLSALHDALRGCGCVIEPQADFEGFSRFHVIDPAGNRIELMGKAAEVRNG